MKTNMDLKGRMKTFLIFATVPLLAYPCWLVPVFLHNSLVGNNGLLMWALVDSKPGLVHLLVRDWIAALPISYFLVVVFILPAYLYAKSSRNPVGPLLHGAALIGAIVLGILFLKDNLWAWAAALVTLQLLTLMLRIQLWFFVEDRG